jgi:hypothetical protein
LTNVVVFVIVVVVVIILSVTFSVTPDLGSLEAFSLSFDS